jgi:hypothetical protein
MTTRCGKHTSSGTLRTRSHVMYVPPQPASPVPDTARVVASTVNPVRRDQHYDTAVSLKIYRFPLWHFTFYHLLITSFAVRHDCGPFTYCRALNGEAGPDVTPGDRGDVPQDGCHHQEVPCCGELPRQPGSTTVSTVPQSSSNTASTGRSHATPSSSSRPPYHAAFYPAHRPLRMSPLGGLLSEVLAYTCTSTRRARTGTTRTRISSTPVPSSALGPALLSGIDHYSIILDCIN